MASLIIETVVRYAILASLLIAGILMIVSVSRDDWMREEITVKYSSIKKVINTTAMENPLLAALGGVPDEAAVEMKAFFGLRNTCFYYMFSGFKKPLKYLMPTIHFCIDNDFFSNPEKFGMPPSMDTNQFKEENTALNGAYICMVTALGSVAIAVIVVVIKAIKWPKKCLIVTIALCLVAALLVAVALIYIKTNFNFKEDFDRAKNMAGVLGSRYGGRTRRDDGSNGYGGQYPAPNQGMVTNRRAKSMMAGVDMKKVVEVMKELEMRETFGCPATMCGVAIGLLLLVSILSVVEIIQKPRSDGEAFNYQNVALT